MSILEPTLLALGIALAAIKFYIIVELFVPACLLIGLSIVFRKIKKITARHIPVTGQCVFITGCDTGIGHHFALRLCQRGFTVFAGCLYPEADGAEQLRSKGRDNLHIVPLDVTKQDSVDKARDYVVQNCQEKGLWAIVNNAGIEFLSDIEMAPIECFKSNAEVNLYGMVRVTKAFLPTIRIYKGRIINVTSVKGRIAVPGNATYVMTKYGGEAFSDCLRREVKRFGVKVIIIEPGNFAITALFSGKNLERFESDLNHSWEAALEGSKSTYGRKYLDNVLHSVDAVAREKYAYPNLNPVMDAMDDSVTNENPQYRYLIDGCSGLLDKYCVLARLNPYLPERFMDYLMEKYFPPTPIAAEMQVTNNKEN